MLIGPKQTLFRGTIATTVASVAHFFGVTDDAAYSKLDGTAGTPETNLPLLATHGAAAILARFYFASITASVTLLPGAPAVCWGGLAGTAALVFPGGASGSGFGQIEIADVIPNAAAAPVAGTTSAANGGVFVLRSRSASSVNGTHATFVLPNMFFGLNTAGAIGAITGLVVEAKCIYAGDAFPLTNCLAGTAIPW